MTGKPPDVIDRRRMRVRRLVRTDSPSYSLSQGWSQGNRRIPALGCSQGRPTVLALCRQGSVIVKAILRAFD